jgi:hypothetical protein
MMSDINKSSGVVFLLGAGASVAAEVPDTFAFVEQFQRSITAAKKRETINKIVATLKRWKPLATDVELLLETLTKLQTRDEEPLLKFIKGGKFMLSGYSRKAPIVKDLKDFIKEKSIIDSDSKIGYFEPLLGFIEEHKPLDILSVNYDTCIEHFSSVYRRRCQDGFDSDWNPKVFEQENVEIRLYKLHGSATWYRTDRGRYIKSDVRTYQSTIELTTGEKAETLILYPMQKSDYAGPLLELLVRAKNLIQDINCKFLVVVGYSFRDDHITRIILEAANKNEELTLIIIDPKASQIYREKLKYYNPKRRIPTHLNERVVCLPYKFEEVFPYLKNEYLRNLREGLSKVSACTSQELSGERANWFDCLERLADAEHIEELQRLLRDKIDDSQLENEWHLNMKLNLRMSLNLAANGRQADAKKYLIKLEQILYGILFENSEIRIDEAPHGIVLEFRFFTQKVGPHRAKIDIDILYSFMKREYAYLLSRSQMAINSKFMGDFKFIESTIKHLDSLQLGRPNFDKFVSSRKAYIEDSQSLTANAANFLKEPTEASKAQFREALTRQIREMEKKVIAGILTRAEIDMNGVK